MPFLQIEIKASLPLQEELIASLDELGATGFEQKDDVLIAFFLDEQNVERKVAHALKDFNYTQCILVERNWNAEWEQSFEPVQVGNFCAVRAHFHAPVTDVLHEIIITPKMSFGTGHHATTYMMMEQMRDISFTGKTVFDFGTGTGVLAILAEKLGAAHIMATDVDEWSIENTKENMNRNFCTQATSFLSSTIPESFFDVILANINRNVLLEFMNQLSNRTKQQGYLLLSGILTEDVAELLQSAEHNNFILQKKVEKNGWVSLLLIKAGQGLA